MSTIAKCKCKFKPVKLDLKRNDYEDRYIFLYKHVEKWLEENIAQMIESGNYFGDFSPKEQIYELFYDFITGKDFKHYKLLHLMNPRGDGVWELKTVDLRFVGCFVQKNVFVIVNVNTMEKIKMFRLYNGYRVDSIKKIHDDGFEILLGDYEDVLQF